MGGTNRFRKDLQSKSRTWCGRRDDLRELDERGKDKKLEGSGVEWMWV